MAASEPPPEILDERLRLVFTCCHPALEPKSRIAPTLRMLDGLTTGDIAAAFLDREETMGQRLSLAKRKLRWPVSPSLYRVSSGGALVRVNLCDEAIWLARMLDGPVPWMRLGSSWRTTNPITPHGPIYWRGRGRGRLRRMPAEWPSPCHDPGRSAGSFSGV